MKLFLILAFILFLLFVTAFIYGWYSFSLRLAAARHRVDEQPESRPAGGVISESEIAKLPPPVRTWLRNSGVVGKLPIRITKLNQSGWIRLKPDQAEWTQSPSEQIINLAAPSFVWNVRMSLQGMPVLGMDQFIRGQGSMWITLFGLIPIARVGPQPKINQSALLRFLGEIVWTPTAALSPWVEWMAIDERSARARMSVDGVSGEAVFHFSESGDVERFVALRYKKITDVRPTEWRADIKAVQTFQGIRIPSAIEATWILPEGTFTWYKFEITHLEYEVGGRGSKGGI